MYIIFILFLLDMITRLGFLSHAPAWIGVLVHNDTELLWKIKREDMTGIPIPYKLIVCKSYEWHTDFVCIYYL